MSIRYMTRDELFTWRDERNDAREVRAEKWDRFHEVSERELKDMNDNERRRELRNAINSSADYIHDATRWDQQDEKDENGKTPMDRLVERIERIYTGQVTG